MVSTCWLAIPPATAQTLFSGEGHVAEIPSFVSRATAAADYDNDGDLDLFVPVAVGDFSGDELNALRRRERSGFADVTLTSGLTISDVIFSNRALWLDYNRDGLIDLYVASFWGCCAGSDQTAQLDSVGQGTAGKMAHPTVRNRLYRNLGAGDFRDVTEEIGLDIRLDFVGGGSNANIAGGDFDGDGWTDIYVNINKSPGPLLFFNGGPLDFADISLDEIAFAGRDHGLAVGDVDNDGDLDLFQASQDLDLFQAAVYLNQGDAFFESVDNWAAQVGLRTDGLSGAALGDVDNDGDLDLQLAGTGQLLANMGDGTWRSDLVDLADLWWKAGPATGVDSVSNFSGIGVLSVPAAEGREEEEVPGSAVLLRDWDGDGFVDAFFGPEVGAFSPSGAFRNRGSGGHWLRVELVGLQSNRSSVGALIAATSGARRQVREVNGGNGLARTLPVHFGLGGEEVVDQLEVFWPSGRIDTLIHIAANQTLRLFEGREEHHPVEPAVWQTPPPDTLVLGSTVEFQLKVQPSLFEPGARIVQISVDLTPFGGAASTPLAEVGEGAYAMETSLVVDGLTGPHHFTISIEQSTSLGPHLEELTRIAHIVLPRSISLAQNFPNPFNSDTSIRFALPREAAVELSLFNLAGQQVTTLINGTRPAGVHTAIWNGHNQSGLPLASGVYFYRLRTNGRSESRKLLLLR